MFLKFIYFTDSVIAYVLLVDFFLERSNSHLFYSHMLLYKTYMTFGTLLYNSLVDSLKGWFLLKVIFFLEFLGLIYKMLYSL